MKNNYYLTTPIYYPNGNLHIGHTYTTIVADVIKRYRKLMGDDVYFVTGTDEHGQKIADTAKKAGVLPLEFTDKIVETTKELWKNLDIDYDRFERTTNKEHEEVVQAVLEKFLENGDLYKANYHGLYCVPCEAYFTESQANDGNCPDCGRPLVERDEESYFFRLSKYEDRILEWIRTADIEPAHVKDEIINGFIKGGLEDLSVTRTSIDWGIELPFDKKHVIYVWVDALVSYLSGIGYLKDEALFEKYWPCDLHLVGKEIVRFHILIWPAVLMALGLPLPKKVFAHGWILFDNDKMSKSKGNVYYPEPIIETLGSDVLRYFILREFSFGSDGNFTIDKLVQRYNSDLVNDLGNLVSRTLAMTEKYFGGVIEAPGDYKEIDKELFHLMEDTKEKFLIDMDSLKFNVALEGVFNLIRRANKYIDETEPWKLAKEDTERLKTVLYVLSDVIVESVKLLKPVMPKTAEKVFDKFSLQSTESIRAGLKVNKGDNLFQRADKDMASLISQKNAELFEERSQKNKKDSEGEDATVLETKEIIDMDTFDKVDLRIGKIVEVEEHSNAKRLYVLKVDIGGEVRTIVSGLREHFSKEELLNKEVLVIVNLKPVNLRGVLSNGMVLAAEKDGVLSLLSPWKDDFKGAVLS